MIDFTRDLPPEAIMRKLLRWLEKRAASDMRNGVNVAEWRDAWQAASSGGGDDMHGDHPLRAVLALGGLHTTDDLNAWIKSHG
ncbi:hypothetical protein SP695_004652 [Salmonella enterica]|nr:hypothetical protein [Salmonella enterica]